MADFGIWHPNLGLAQRERDLFVRELGFLHAKPPVSVSFDFARFLSYPLEAFPGTHDFDRQVAEIQVRIACLNRYTRLGIPVPKPID